MATASTPLKLSLLLALLLLLVVAYASGERGDGNGRRRFKRRRLSGGGDLRHRPGAARSRSLQSKRYRDFMQRMIRKRRLNNLPKRILARLNSTRVGATGDGGKGTGPCDELCDCERGGETVNCRSKQLSDVPSGIPRGAVTVSLAYNAIDEIGGFQFALLGDTLRTLKLEGNKIHKIRSFAFSGLTRLRTLTLQFNELAALRHDVFRGLVELVTLRLGYNKIELLQPHTFRGLHKLQSVDLDGNRLTAFHPDTFATLKLGPLLRYFSSGFSFFSLSHFGRPAGLRSCELLLDYRPVRAVIVISDFYSAGCLCAEA